MQEVAPKDLNELIVKVHQMQFSTLMKKEIFESCLSNRLNKHEKDFCQYKKGYIKQELTLQLSHKDVLIEYAHVLNKEKFELIVLVQVVNEFTDFATYTKKKKIKKKRFLVL